MLNPCCGRDLAHVAKTVAVFDVVRSYIHVQKLNLANYSETFTGNLFNLFSQILSILELAAAMVLESTPVTILSTDVADPEKRDVNYVGKMQKFLFTYRKVEN